MDGLGFLGSQFPPGFRFHPTDQELIIHYLRSKVTSSLNPATSIVADIDLYKFNPWELPGKAFFGEGEWFFFSPRDRKYPNGARPNRAAGSGYWKATGTDKPIIASGGSQCLGVKKALVFYLGRPPKGIKTDWLMHEYRLLDDNKSSTTWNQKPRGSMRLDDWVLCRVRQKGSTPTETEEKSINPPIIQNTSKEPELKAKSNSLYEWSDYQLLAYLLNSQEGGESGYGDSEVDSKKVAGLNNMGGGFQGNQKEKPQEISSMLNSIKRTLSFGILDEMMMMPPAKRLQFSGIIEEQSSPSGSVSVEETFPEFLL